MSGVDAVITKARSYIGTVEGSQAHKEIIDAYNSCNPPYKLNYHEAWCAAFVCAIFKMCGLVDLVPLTAYVPSMVDTFIERNQWKWRKEYTPVPGDIIFYDWNDNNQSDHVGIVQKVEGGRVYAIEGNYSTAGTVAIRNIPLDWSYIRGYGIPNYSQESYTNYYSKLSTQDRAFVDKLPLIRTGSAGVAVKLLQTLMNMAGYLDKPIEVDGKFGSQTKARLIDYQTYRTIEPDGECGQQTWSAALYFL